MYITICGFVCSFQFIRLQVWSHDYGKRVQVIMDFDPSGIDHGEEDLRNCEKWAEASLESWF
jgi:hypothetical protein